MKLQQPGIWKREQLDIHERDRALVNIVTLRTG